MQLLKQNTAVRISVGPMLDKTDGITPETGIAVTGCLLTMVADYDNGSGVALVLSAYATTGGGNNDMVHITNDSGGYYDLELTAANTNYLGRAKLTISNTAVHCPAFHEFMILPSSVYDSLVGNTDTLPVDVTQFGGSNGTFTGGRAEVNASHLGGSAIQQSGGYIKISEGTGTGQLDLTAGRPGIDWNKVSNQGSTVALTGTTVKTATDVRTDTTEILTRIPDATAGASGGLLIAGSNAATTFVSITSTGNNISWNSSWDSEVESECTDALNAYDPPTNTEMNARTLVAASYATATGVAAIGASGNGLSGIPWNAAWDSEVQSEVQDALEVNNLDHLLKVAKDTNWATTVTKESIIDMITSKDSNQTYDRSTDSLEPIRDAITTVTAGVAATITATGNIETSGTLITGTYASTYLSNGTYWTTAPVNPGGILAYLGFGAASGQYANSVTIRGYFAGGGRYCNVGAYNYITSGIDILSDSTSRMNNATSNGTYTYQLLSNHQKSNGEIKIYFESPSTATADRLNIDQCLININTAGATAADIAEAVKQKMITTYYEGGIWYDDINGTSGTILGSNGTSTNPVNNTGDAYTLCNLLGTKRLYLKPASNFTLAEDSSNWRFIGAGKINLNGKNIEDAVFENLYIVSGTGIGEDMNFYNCGIGDIKLDHCYISNSKLKGILDLYENKDYFFINCSDTTPSAGNSTTINFESGSTAVFRDWRGGIIINNMTSGNNCIVDGAGRITINGSGGSLTVRGHFPEITNAANFIASGGTINDVARWAEDQSVGDVTGIVNSNITQVGGSDTPIDGKSLEAALRYIAAICAGKINGAGTGTEIFKGLDGSTTRVTVNVDSNGNRTGVIYD